MRTSNEVDIRVDEIPDVGDFMRQIHSTYDPVSIHYQGKVDDRREFNLPCAIC